MSEEKDKDFISSIPSYLPLVTILTVSFGVLRLTIFYGFFNLNILSYLDLTEIIFQSLKEFILMATVLILGFVFSSFIAYSGNWDDIDVEVVVSSSFKRNLYLISIATIILLIVIGVYNIIDEDNLLIISAIIIALLISLFIFIGIGRYHIKKKKKTIGFQILPSVIIIVGLMVMSILGSYRKLTHLKRDNDYLNNSITIEKKTITSTYSYYYIGKTRNYVFFFNETTRTTDIFPMDKIDKLSVKE